MWIPEAPLGKHDTDLIYSPLLHPLILVGSNLVLGLIFFTAVGMLWTDGERLWPQPVRLVEGRANHVVLASSKAPN